MIIAKCVTVQAIYAESIRYTNAVSGDSVTTNQLRLARADEAEVPVLSKGTRIIVLAPDEAHTMERGSRSPFWVAEVEEDEEVALGACAPPARMHCVASVIIPRVACQLSQRGQQQPCAGVPMQLQIITAYA